MNGKENKKKKGEEEEKNKETSNKTLNLYRKRMIHLRILTKKKGVATPESSIPLAIDADFQGLKKPKLNPIVVMANLPL